VVPGPGAAANDRLRPQFAALAAAAAVGAVIVTVIVFTHQVIPADVTIEDDIQSTNWGPLALTFPIFTWIGDIKGFFIEAIVFVGILLLNRRAWLTALACAATGVWYFTLSHFFIRVRPTTHYVLRVTEHPGASSFPSGHTIFVTTLVTVLMLCFGHRFLPRWAIPIGWVLAAATVVACGISRIDSGAHWPTDVVAAILIAVAWLSFVVSVRFLSDGALERDTSPPRTSA
jgi:membrane-associated phospholipid phosphatase